MNEIKNILFFSSDEPGESKSNRFHVAKHLSENFKVIYVYRQFLTFLSVLKRPSRLKEMLKLFNVTEEKKNFITITMPLCLPGNFSIVKRINMFILIFYLRRILKKLNITEYLTWVVTPYQLELLKYFPGMFSVYHCHDGFAYYPGVNRHEIISKEDELKKMVDLIFYASHFLFNNSGYSDKSFYIGHGFDSKFLECNKYSIPEDMKEISKPVVGFHGVLDFHSDEQLLEFLINRNSNISFVFVGPVYSKRINVLLQYRNFFMLGQKKFEALPGYLKCFDIAILPYKKIPMTNACSPLKLYEYLACGMPVLTIDMPEAHVHKDYIHIAKDYEHFNTLLRELIFKKHNSVRQKDYAKNHLWSKKVAFMVKNIQQKYSTKR